MPQPDHPSIDRLTAFGLGHLSEKESVDLENHLRDCEICRGVLDTVPNDAVVRILRDTSDRPETTGDLSTRADYRTLHFHARGGLGEVSVAEDRTFGRRVAVKRMRADGPDSADRSRRFLREAVVTGRLEHPGIVPVYGVGEDEAGRPCYAMRFVSGVTLQHAIKTLHAARPVPHGAYRELLGRFLAVCAAVGYAHSRGVIHRDIKPANIAIGEFGETILLDWGIAQTDDDGPVVTAESGRAEPGPFDRFQTATGTVLGTPGYMAPEQARGERVGPGADVYALGATLWAIVTGAVPPKPADPPGPKALLAIARKAMAEAPADRYPTAAALAEDVDRWRSGEPVHAYRDPFLTRAWRFIYQHQTAAAATFVLLLVGTVSLAVGTVLLDGEQRKTAQALDERTAALRAEEDQRRTAVAKEAETAAVLQFVEGRVFSAGRPKGRPGGLGRDVKLIDAIAAAAAFIGDGFRDQPLTEARLRATIGLSFEHLGESASAEPHYVKARDLYATHRGPTHPDTLTAMSNLAVCYRSLGRNEESMRLNEEVLAQRRIQLGSEHNDTLRSILNLANNYADLDRAEDVLRLDVEVYEIRKATLGLRHADTLISMRNMAVSYSAVGRKDEALKWSLEVVPLLRELHGPDSPETLIGMNNLANRYHELARYDEAIELRKTVLEKNQSINGPNHPDTLTAMSNLARSYGSMKNYDEALRRHREVLTMRVAKLTTNHPDTSVSRFNVVNTLVDMGRGAEAIPLIDEAVRELAPKPTHAPMVAGMIEVRKDYFSGRSDVAGCRATAEMWEALNRTDATSLFLAARLRAVAAKVGSTQSSPDADQAIGWLKQAAQAGYKDLKRWQTEKDLDHLRSRPDFPSLPAKK